MIDHKDAVATLDEFIAQVERHIPHAAPMSQRARALTSMVRFAARARQFSIAQRAGQLPFRQLAEVLELRDMARREQAWIDDILRDEAPEQDHLDRLHIYKIHLAQIEQTAMMALSYVKSDKEDSAEAGWWAHRGGMLIMETIALAPQLLALPSDRIGPSEEQ